MSDKRLSKEELYHLRNNIPITDVIKKLDIPFKTTEGYFRFLCPECQEFNTSVYLKKNLARCFLCRKNYNPIDLVLKVKSISFIETADYLTGIFATDRSIDQTLEPHQKRPPAKAPCSIKDILNSPGFTMNTSPNHTPQQPTLSHQELLLKINRLEQTIKTLTLKINSIEKKMSQG